MSLTNRKLKVWSSSPRGQVTVFQDGTAADGDATSGYKFDDAFRSGALEPGYSGRTGLVWVHVQSLAMEWEYGQTMSFVVTSPAQYLINTYPNLAIDVNDFVEFYCDAPPNDTNVATPSYHLNDQTGQVRIFRGWVEEVRPEGGRLIVNCQSAFWRSQDVVLVRSGAEGITIPKIAFNLPKDHADHFYSIKNLGGGDYGTGSAPIQDDALMTLKEILEYLASEYSTDLQNAGVTTQANIFETGDLNGLTIRPGPVIFDSTGFGAAVQSLLNQFAPDMRIFTDPRTTKWRLVRTLAGFSTQSATISGISIVGANSRVFVDDSTPFSTTPGDAGNVVRVVHHTDPNLSTTGIVVGKAGGYVDLSGHLDGHYLTAFIVGAKLIPMQAEVLPTVGFSYDTDIVAGSLVMSRDARDVFTAVSIVSTHHETTTMRLPWTPGGVGTQDVEPAWDRSMDQFWKEDADPNREHDYGTEGDGLEIYTIDALGTGGTYRLTAAAEDSVFGDDHVSQEWVGSTLWIFTADGTSVRGQNYHYTVLANENIGDIGDGRPGIRFRIQSTTLVADVGGTLLAADTDPSGDRFGINSSFSFRTTTSFNARWAVGRVWKFTDVSLQSGGATLHNTTCTLPQVMVDDGTGINRQEMTLHPNLQHPLANEQPTKPFLDCPSGTGLVCEFQRVFYLGRPAVNRERGIPQACASGTWQPPKRIEVTYEVTETAIREARYPGSGYDEAWRHHGIERTKNITARYWTNDDQTSDYEDLALRIWNVTNKINHRGSVRLKNASEHLAWLDLGVKAAFTTYIFPQGAPAQIRSFWAHVNRIEYDLSTLDGTVTLTFDPDNALKRIASDVYEDYFIGSKALLRDLEDRQRKALEIPTCLAGSRPNFDNPYLCDSLITSGNRPSKTYIRLPSKDNLAHGNGETSIAANLSSAGRASTHGMRATETGFRDLAGNHFVVGSQGEINNATLSGGTLTTETSPSTAPVTIGAQAQSSAAAAAAMWGLTPVVTEPPIFTTVEIVANSTDTVWTLGQTGWTTNELVGGTLYVLDYNQALHREGYEITANSSTTVTTALLTDALPEEGTRVNIFRKPSPTADETDFPDGGYVALDTDGNYVVVDPVNGTVSAGTLNGSTNKIEAASGDPVALRLGLDAGNSAVLSYVLSDSLDLASAAANDGRLVLPVTFALATGGNVVTGTNVTNSVIVPYPCTILKAYAAAKVGPTGADLIFDLNVNGSTIWSDPGDRLTIADGATTDLVSTFTTTVLAEDDEITIDVDQIGSVDPGGDITVTLILLAQVLQPVTFALARGVDATTGTAKTNPIVMPFAGTILRADAAAGVGPTGADLIFDVNLNGSTIWSTSANRAKIVAGATTGTQSTFDTTAFSAGDVLTVDIDQVGSTVAGSDITLTLLTLTQLP